MNLDRTLIVPLDRWLALLRASGPFGVCQAVVYEAVGEWWRSYLFHN